MCAVALRQFRRAPLFALLTVASLALGIGANTRHLQRRARRAAASASVRRRRRSWSASGATTRASRGARQSGLAGQLRGLQGRLVVCRRRGDVLVPDSACSSASTATPKWRRRRRSRPACSRSSGGRRAGGRDVRRRGTRSAGGPELSVLAAPVQRRSERGRPRRCSLGATTAATIAGVMPEDFAFPYRSMLGPSGFTRALQADLWIPLTPAGETRAGRRERAAEPDHSLSRGHRPAEAGRVDRSRARGTGRDRHRLAPASFRTRTRDGA